MWQNSTQENKKDLEQEIYEHLDIIKAWADLTTFALENEYKHFENGSLFSIFRDINKNGDKIAELVEKLTNNCSGDSM